MHALDHDSPACAMESKYLQSILMALGYHLMVLHFGLTRFARTLLRIGRNAILALQNQLRCWGFSSARECYSSLRPAKTSACVLPIRHGGSVCLVTAARRINAGVVSRHFT